MEVIIFHRQSLNKYMKLFEIMTYKEETRQMLKVQMMLIDRLPESYDVKVKFPNQFRLVNDEYDEDFFIELKSFVGEPEFYFSHNGKVLTFTRTFEEIIKSSVVKIVAKELSTTIVAGSVFDFRESGDGVCITSSIFKKNIDKLLKSGWILDMRQSESDRLVYTNSKYDNIGILFVVDAIGDDKQYFITIVTK